MKRMITAVVALTLVAAACSDGRSDSASSTQPAVSEPTVTTSAPATSTTSPPGSAATTATASSAVDAGLPEGPSALDFPSSSEFPEPLVPVAEIISGGPPPDGIPPIDAPTFVTIDAAGEWLQDAEPVVALEIGGEARAYPVQILIWHEIVNDTVGGVPISVTYCPLCNSAVTYRRTVDGVETTFGTSGSLFASALVMYDRATESLWTHFDGKAVVGVLTGRVLEPIASPLLSWADFKAAYPAGLVLDRETTGHSRPYGQNPYAGYDNPNATPFLFRGSLDDREAAMRRVVGITIGDAASAWTLDSISDGAASATNADLSGRPLVILWKSGQASALDASAVAGGDDVGSVGVFDPIVDGRTLTFGVAEDGAFVDDETGSTWDITGISVSGELAGAQLERIVHLDTFWFAWSTYQPGTALVTQ